MKKPDLSIIIPWLSKSDWTGLIFSSLKKAAEENNFTFNTIIGSRVDNKKKAQKQEPFSFLYPKLRVVEKMVDFSHKNMLANRIIIVDSSFVNMKAVRYIAGKESFISCFVNGGFFQEYDLDRQTISGYDKELKKFEEGHYSLMDKILLPSKYSLRIFLEAYPDLKKKSLYTHYSLRDTLTKNYKFFDKHGCVYVSRHSLEKGYDIISTLNKKNIKMDSILGLKNHIFRKKLLKYKSVIIPSRADLFGFCALEAILEGTIPVVPAGLSYDELIDVPNNFKLSLPIGKRTKKEIETIVELIEDLSESQYNEIILKARKSLQSIMNNKNHNFSAALKTILYEKKK
jgi:hypothetical protein